MKPNKKDHTIKKTKNMKKPDPDLDADLMPPYLQINMLVQPTKSKTALLFLELLGYTGLDRLYLGCVTSGVIKFLLYFALCIVNFYYLRYVQSLGEQGEIDDTLPIVYAFHVLFTVVIGWAVLDWTRVIINVMRRDPNILFCKSYVWQGLNDTDFAFMLGFFFIAISIVNLFVIVPSIINENRDLVVSTPST